MRPSRVLAVMLVVLAFSGSLWAQDVIYGCVKNNNGQVRMVAAGEKCLPSEHAVLWQANGSTVPLPTTPPTTPAPGPLKVVDQDGKALGWFVTSAAGSVAARLVDGDWLALPLTTNGFYTTSAAEFRTYYLTTDCSGDAYLPVDPNSLLRTGFVVGNSFSYGSKPEVDRTAIHSYGQLASGAFACTLYTPGYWAPPVYGKVMAVEVGTFNVPFKIVQ